MSVLIYQLFKPLPESEQYVKYDRRTWLMSSQSIKKYAETLGHEYRFFDDSNIHPRYSPFHPFVENLHKDYEKIVFVDSDVLATRNVRDIAKGSSNAMISIKQSVSGPLFVPKFAEQPEGWVLKNWSELNSGVVVFPRAQYENVEKILPQIEKYQRIGSWDRGGWDQEILFDLAKTHGYYDLDFRYNYMMTYYKHRYRFEQTLIHYHYNKKDLLIQDFSHQEILK